MQKRKRRREGTQYLRAVGLPTKSSSYECGGIYGSSSATGIYPESCTNWELQFAPCTILRWVVRYSIELSHRCQRYEKPVGRSWRADETYVRVSGRWMYLYRTVDELGHTVASHLRRTRDMTAAKTFFRKALKQHGQPRTITLDGFEPSHSALRRMGMHNEFNYRFENPVRIRSSQYLNNIVEQDHRRIKFRLQPMLGMKSFYNARRVIAGTEFMQMIHKDQFFIPHD
jgi:transposase-like protein